jgi:LysM repeat protein
MATPPDAAAEPARAPAPPDPVAPEAPSSPLAIREICPYLVASQGGWRTAGPNRDHRCFAVEPPGPLPTDKQRTLCLTAEHAGCPAFRAARASRASMLAPGLDPAVVAAADGARRPIARAAPVVVEGPRLSIGGVGGGNWAVSQAVLVGLMILAFAVVLVARLSSPASTVPPASVSPSAIASPSPIPTPRPTPSPSLLPSGSGEVPAGSGAAPSAAASQAATIRTTYRVKAGDTLVGIASTYGTSVGQIQQLNGLSGTDLKIGQLLKIP